MRLVQVVPLFVALAAMAPDARGQTALEVEGQLQSSSAGDRETAARVIAESSAVPPRVAAILVDAAARETDHDAFVAMLRALGRTGAMEARAILDPHVLSPDDAVRAAARDGLRDWLVRNALLKLEEPLPEPPHQLYGAPPKLPPSEPAAHSLLALNTFPPPLGSDGYSTPPPHYLAPPEGTPWAARQSELGLPPGFEAEETRRYDLALAGGAGFVGSYLASVIAGAVALSDEDEEYSPLFIPLVGPWVAIATVSSHGSSGDQELRGVEHTLLVLDGLVQAAGVTLGAVGLAMGETVVVRAAPGGVALAAEL